MMPYVHLVNIILPLFIFFVPVQAQQKPQFSQYMFNALVINPAYAGADEALSITFIHRNQWNGVDGAPSTQTFSAHTLFKKKQFGLGLVIVNDKIGIHKNLSALTNYAYHLPTGKKSFLSIGVQAGIHHARADYASLTGTSAINDPNLYRASSKELFFDLGLGAYFRSPRLHIGLSAPELLPQQFTVNDSLSTAFDRANIFLFFKYRIKQNEIIQFEPSFLIKYLHNLPVSYDITLNTIYRHVASIGISYRRNDSIDFLFKAQLTPQLEMGYSYDYSIGNLSVLSAGSHELMIRYLFRFIQSNISSPR